jgi:hypothetical protein
VFQDWSKNQDNIRPQGEQVRRYLAIGLLRKNLIKEKRERLAVGISSNSIPECS